MKKYIYGLLVLLGVSCQNNSQPQAQTVTNMKNELKLKLKITKMGMVGYGYIFGGIVQEVLVGSYESEKISIVIMDDELVEKYKLDKLPQEIVVSFKKGEENMEYRIMPINGFVDENKTAWIMDTELTQDNAE